MADVAVANSDDAGGVVVAPIPVRVPDKMAAGPSAAVIQTEPTPAATDKAPTDASADGVDIAALAPADGDDSGLTDEERQLRRRLHPPKHSRGDTALAMACSLGDSRYEAVKVLTEEKYAFNTINLQSTMDGGTPLMRAAEAGGIRVVQLLVERGADMSQTNYAGHTALHVALAHSQQEVASYLKSAGVKTCAGGRCATCRLGLKLITKRQAGLSAAAHSEDAAAAALAQATADAERAAELLLEQEEGRSGADASGTPSKSSKSRNRRRKGKTTGPSSASALEMPAPMDDAGFIDDFESLDLMEEIAKFKAEVGEERLRAEFTQQSPATSAASPANVPAGKRHGQVHTSKQTPKR